MFTLHMISSLLFLVCQIFCGCCAHIAEQIAHIHRHRQTQLDSSVWNECVWPVSFPISHSHSHSIQWNNNKPRAAAAAAAALAHTVLDFILRFEIINKRPKTNKTTILKVSFSIIPLGFVSVSHTRL